MQLTQEMVSYWKMPGIQERQPQAPLGPQAWTPATVALSLDHGSLTTVTLTVDAAWGGRGDNRTVPSDKAQSSRPVPQPHFCFCSPG